MSVAEVEGVEVVYFVMMDDVKLLFFVFVLVGTFGHLQAVVEAELWPRMVVTGVLWRLGCWK
jgi:hypothetical protein